VPGRRPRSVAEGRRRHFADARAAAAGTRWLAGLTTSAGQLITSLQPDATDPVDAAAINGIAASRLHTMPGTKFAAVVQAVTGGLAQTQRATVRGGPRVPWPARRHRRARPLRR
jgi:hypothetical protein